MKLVTGRIGMFSLALAAGLAGSGCKDDKDSSADDTGSDDVAADDTPKEDGGLGDDMPVTDDTTPPDDDMMPPPAPGPKKLWIMQWAHFVPEYVEWTESMTTAWKEENDIELNLEWVASEDLIKRLEGHLVADEGPDLIEVTTPIAQFQKGLFPLNDIVEELNKKYGAQLEFCAKGTYNANTKEYWGFGHAWVAHPDLYRSQAWTDAGFPDGPQTWEDLATGGATIYNAGAGPSVIIGMGQENDSEKILRGLLWSYGASEQDEKEQVSINSPETRAAMVALKKVYDEAIVNPAVGAPEWNAGANNAMYLEGTASYLVNPVSAYRTAQVEVPEVAEDTGIKAPLKGSTGKGYATIGNVPIFVIPKYSKNKEVAQEYLRHYMSNYGEAVLKSKMFNLPCWPGTTPQLDEKDGWLEVDPFAPAAYPNQRGRLALLKEAASWTRHYGYPGTTNAAIGQIITEHVLPTMFKSYIIDGVDIDMAIEAAETRMNEIFEEQRKAGLVK